ncbi:ribonuclease HII [Candidatus Marinamargulisbacteria bacterium SCGC AG-410-N11]|nr:ribonuclease HII [Candidatus Marinamargulisbacteria bacterium SCGC AG-410-N11]
MEPSIVVGVDEAGRGALAGPVVASAVIINKSSKSLQFKDSKALSPSARKKLYDLINKTCLIGIGIIQSKEIDKINILQASLKAMKKAILDLNPPKNAKILVDGNKIPNLKQFNIQSIVKGDQYINQISAASIIAKITRDSIMNSYMSIYKGYSFDSHKGYGTKKHYQEIHKLGITENHRRSFNLTIQQTLFCES